MAEKSSLPPHIQVLLDQLRVRIKAYVWIEGITLALIWLALTFWVTMLIDFVVLVRWLGISELSLGTRAVLLAVIALTMGFILFRYILQRTFVRLQDRNIALLLERKFKVFRDSLVTAVEMSEHPDHAADFSTDMLSHTADEAVIGTNSVNVGEVLNWRRLGVLTLTTVAVIAPIGLLFALSPSTVNTLVARVYGLQNIAWPRKSEIEVVGVEMQRPESLARVNTRGSMLSFEDKRIKVAKGSNLSLWIRANAEEKEVPDFCTIFYRTKTENTRGRRNMKKIGSEDAGFQRFSFSDKPLEGILDSVRFDVKGRDFWIRDFEIEVVENPMLNEVLLDYVPPKYTGLSSVSEDKYVRGKPIRRGSHVTVHFRSNKELQQAVLHDPQAQRQLTIVLTEVIGATGEEVPIQLTISTDISQIGRATVLALSADIKLLVGSEKKEITLSMEEGVLSFQVDGDSPQPVKAGMAVTVESGGLEHQATLTASDGDLTTFRHVIPRLNEDMRLDVSLFDTDGVITEEPYNVALSAIADEPPEVRTELTGIGAMITPDAIIPVSGEIQDDLGVASSRLEIGINMADPDKAIDPIKVPFNLLANGVIKTQFDFRLARQNNEAKIELKPKDKLVINVIAEDKCTLDGSPNRGEGAPFEIEVVTPDELLRALERRELSLRRNYEKIVGEVQNLRDSLARIEEGLRLGDSAKSGAGAEPGDKKISADELAKRGHGFRLRLIQGAATTSETAARETSDVADSFDAIREELLNNRIIDAGERIKRIKDQIAVPLKEIATKEFTVLDEYLRELEKQLGTEIAKNTAKKALNKSDYILAQMESILEKMLELEDFNELLKIVRDLIKSQEELIRKTEKVQTQDLLDLLKRP